MTRTGATNPVRKVIVEPDPTDAPLRAKAHFETQRHSDGAMITRRELGIQRDRPIIMTGHQVAWWHAGILAKYMACESIARCAGAASVWVTPDQDVSDYAELSIPAKDSTGRISRATVTLNPEATAARAPAASEKPIPSDSLPPFPPPALPSIGSGLDRMRDALGAHESAPSAAKQISGALTDLMAPHVAPAPVLFASELAKCDSFNRIVDRLRDDAPEATRLYNDAAARTAQARVAPLLRTPSRDRYELPLWRLEQGQPRRTVFAHEIDSIPREQLAPKALLFTGFLRLYACDLFIHGTGGGLYDRVTEDWMRAWLGEELAPKLIVSATLQLPLANEAPSPTEIDRAVWTAHHARHHPTLLGLEELQHERDNLARKVRLARESGETPGAAYSELHAWLDRYRLAHRDALDSLRREAETMLLRRDEAAIAADRTWPFYLHPSESLQSLADCIDSALCPAATTVR